MRGAATKSMSDIVEERQQRRYAPFAAAPLLAAARRPAGFVARSSHTAWVLLVARALPAGTAGRSPGGLQQNVKLFLREPLIGPFCKESAQARNWREICSIQSGV